ncbi:Crustacean calcium-binding protein 23 [Diplonema papillatum]|nr:Crustacean calcium-binding protein 23 [Diplonema papillatum]
MGEHLEERASERLRGALNQPLQRGYHQGCHQRGTQGVGKNAYNVKTLMGNWREEQSDVRFSSRRPLILSDDERKLNEHRTCIMAQAGTDSVHLRRDHTHKDSQPNMVTLVNKEHTNFPGHQPAVDPHLKNNKFDQWGTETTVQFKSPALADGPAPPRVHGKGMAPGDKETGVIQRVRGVLLARGGGTGFRGIRRSLKVMDSNGNNQLSVEELREGLEMFGVSLTTAEFGVVFSYFDKDKSGSITLTEFLAGVRGQMNDRRLRLVRQAYKLLDRNLDGRVLMDDIRALYDASRHPQVLRGEATEDEVLQVFISSWDSDGDSEITMKEFVEYYNDISAGIDNEQYFELMIRNAWHMSGGQGAAANTSCRRVLVTHRNGKQTVEEIKNDLGIGPRDLDKMRENLANQGITDTIRIDVTG